MEKSVPTIARGDIGVAMESIVGARNLAYLRLKGTTPDWVYGKVEDLAANHYSLKLVEVDGHAPIHSELLARIETAHPLLQAIIADDTDRMSSCEDADEEVLTECLVLAL